MQNTPPLLLRFSAYKQVVVYVEIKWYLYSINKIKYFICAYWWKFKILVFYNGLVIAWYSNENKKIDNRIAYKLKLLKMTIRVFRGWYNKFNMELVE